MGKRSYNILFNLHTVSGIVISVALFVIFFAGSFSFFRDEIISWERDQNAVDKIEVPQDIDSVIKSLKENYNLYARTITIEKYFAERRVNVSLNASKDSLASIKDKVGTFFYLDPVNYKTSSYLESYTLGEFLYRLHFFAQIYYPIGYYLSGFVAFFFLLAIVTGVLVHWKKIISNFYVFRPWAKLKTLWTDAHTALGMIGLPFQLVYAVTGAFFILKVLLVAPSVFALYGGNQQELYQDLEYSEPNFPFKNIKQPETFQINPFIEKTKNTWPGFQITKLTIVNYGANSMHVAVNGSLDVKSKFTSPGNLTFNVSTGKIISQKNPYQSSSYLDGVKNVMYRLHYGDYGGYALKLISFVLGISSCLVILSGVMIWLAARNKKNIPEKKQIFYHRVAHIYLAICLSMYPITALSFIAVKIVHPATQSFIYWFYFTGWLLFSLFFIFKKSNLFTIKFSLICGGIIGFIIPIVNGSFTGNWFWKTFALGKDQIFFVDLFWVFTAAITLYIGLNLKKKV